MSVFRGFVGGVALGRAASRLRVSARPATPLLLTVRHHWNKDFKAGPYPTTPEERKAAAKKYNLPEEWYEVYPDDGFGYGDYPKLPLVSTEARSDYYPWDYPEFKRNFNEPVHVDEDIINDTRINVSHRFLVPIWEQVLWLLGVISGAFGLFYYFEDYDLKMYHCTLPKQMPHKGEVHYTFEPLNSK